MITGRALFLFAVMITVLFATVQTAQAAGTPTQLIVFTDKMVYQPMTLDLGKSGGIPSATGVFTDNYSIFVYAIVLDDDGNILKGRSLTGYVLDSKVLEHDTNFQSPTAGDLATHNSATINSNGAYWGNITLNFVDDGSVFGDTSGDGIYTARANPAKFVLSAKQGSGGSTWYNFTTPTNKMIYPTDHILLNVTVIDSSGLKANTVALISGFNCMGNTEGTGGHSAHVTSSTVVDVCTICHLGSEHFFENKSGTIPESYLDVHSKKLPNFDFPATVVNKFSGKFRWNASDYRGSASTLTWSQTSPGSQYCLFCHSYNQTLSKIISYGYTDSGSSAVRSNASDVPLCNNAACHPSTKMEKTSSPAWLPLGATMSGWGTVPSVTWPNANISNSKSHNRTSERVPCALCHGTQHSYNLPNTTINTTSKPINEQCWLCHNISGGLNITANGGSNIDHSSNDCKSCHSNDADALDVHKVPSAGNPDCISCHDSGKTANKRINNSAMNSSNASHARLNRNAVNLYGVSAENKKCWGCHTSNGSQPGNNSMGNRNDNPYKCYDCHNATGKPYANASTGMNVSEHFKGGAQITAASTAAGNSSSCLICHNLSELKVAYTEDDSYSTDYSLASHYARNRTDLRTWNSSRAVNCSYCHQNASTAFSTAMLDPSYNSSIQNHSASNSPVCFNSTCHGSGWIHNSTLTRYALPLPNSTYCQLCHPEKQKHNGTQNCTQCHANTSSNDTIHPIKYLQMNGSFITSNTSSANCTNCHQGTGMTGFSIAPIIPNPLKHSSNISNGTLWGTYWTSGNSSCYYCHSNTKHNSTALGNISAILNSYNVREGSLITTQWCADCHYNDSINTDFKGSLWNPAPPYISYDNTGKSGWINHNSYFSSGYNDSVCKVCHALNGSYAATSLNYSHSLDPGAGGNPNCITCHNLVTGLSGGAPSGINFTAANASIHNGTNSNNATAQGFVPVIGSCWACHDSDGNVTSGHPDRYKQPKACTECHIGTGTFNASAYNAIIVSEHFFGGAGIKAGNSSSNISSCINCHENISEMVLYNNDTDYSTSFTGDGIRLVGGNMSFYHYGKNRTDIRNGPSAICTYCHQNASTAFSSAMINSSYNKSIGNHSNYSSNPGCTSSQCHNAGWLHNSTLTKPYISIPNSTFCLNCHGKNSTSGLINFTGAVTPVKEKHNSSMNCSECHLNTAKDVHPVKYLRQDATFSTLNTSAVNCITCHQTTSVDSKLILAPPKISSTMHHSDSSSNGTIWDSTAYWTPTNPLTSCTYCHNDTKHNASALGRPAGWQGNNAVNSSLPSGTWCASCHYKNYASGSRNYSDMIQAFTSANLPVPPEITNGSYAIKIFNRSNYYNHSLKDYTDAVCRLCHGANLSSTATISELMHNVTVVNTCTGCHYSFEAMNNTTRPDRYVDFSVYNTSLHRSLSCTDCHTKGHRNIGARKACEDCHAVQANPITDKDRHNITTTPSTYFVGASNVINITDCTTCHDSVLYNKSTSTYGYWKPKDCDYCHTYPDKYYE